MSQFRSAGGLDEAINEDFDRGFFSVNQRLQSNQLQEGEVRESLNGRMEGYWKPRKGVVAKTAALTTQQVPLQLPFLLMAVERTISAASIVGSTVTITISGAHGITSGDFVSTSKIGYVSGANPNGVFQVTVTNTTQFTYTLVGGSGTYTVAGAIASDLSKTITAASYAANLVTITIASHGFPLGTSGNASISGLTFTGVNNNGVRELEVATVNTLTFPVAGVTGVTHTANSRITQLVINDIANANVVASCLFSDPNTSNKEYIIVAMESTAKRIDLGSPKLNPIVSASQSGFLVTMQIDDHGLTAGSSVLISGLTGGTPANGSFDVLEVIDENSFSYLFTTNQAVTFGVTSSSMSVLNINIPYSIGQTVNAGAEMIQLFDKIMLFRDGQQALEWFPNGRSILSASQAGTTTVTMSVREHGLAIGTTITIAGLTGGTPPNGRFVVASVVDQDTFTYVFTTSQTIAFGTSVAMATDGFTLSPAGAYTQPQTFNITAKDVDILDGLVTATVVGNVTIKTGDVIVVRQTATIDFAEMLGKEYQVTEATTTTIKWYAPVGNYDTSSSDIFEFGGRFSVGGGFMHQPAAPWGIHFQRRLWVPYYYDQTGSFNAPSYNARNVSDEIAVSDILDTTTFDQIENQFRISGGTADFIVGMHGFYNDALIVLNRNSLHIVENTSGSLLDCSVKELTSEIGCLARKSVVMRGNTMMFLSDDGVYSLEFLNDYNLRGSNEPISKNIQTYIDRINKDYAGEAVGILFDNRYYLAIALDSSVGADDAQGNNAILVYNFKNNGWESLDTYGDTRFLIKNLIIGGAGIKNELYAVTSNGGVHQLDAAESLVDRLNVSNVGGSLTTPEINSSLTTRGYDLKTMERKRFTDAQINMQNLAGDAGEYEIAFTTEDPDTISQTNNSIQLIGTTTQFLGGTVLSPSTPSEAETASIRCRLAGIRGYTGTIILTRTIGSPKIGSIKISGSIANRQIISQK